MAQSGTPDSLLNGHAARISVATKDLDGIASRADGVVGCDRRTDDPG